MARTVNNDTSIGVEWSAAVAAGFDMSLIEISLAKSPWERLVEHDEALEFADELRNAGKKLHEQA